MFLASRKPPVLGSGGTVGLWVTLLDHVLMLWGSARVSKVRSSVPWGSDLWDKLNVTTWDPLHQVTGLWDVTASLRGVSVPPWLGFTSAFWGLVLPIGGPGLVAGVSPDEEVLDTSSPVVLSISWGILWGSLAVGGFCGTGSRAGASDVVPRTTKATVT